MKRLENYFFTEPLSSSEKLFLGASACFLTAILLSQIVMLMENWGLTP